MLKWMKREKQKEEDHPMIIHTDKAPAAVGPYSQAIQAGNMLFTSGQLGLVPETGALPEGIEAQTRQSLANVDAILAAAGFAKTDVTKTTVYIKNMGDFGTVNGIYAEYFGDHKPARSCVEAARLPKDGLVEIEIIAAK
jgi:2-iminobutanoate/2-iminopropanoate deaminase